MKVNVLTINGASALSFETDFNDVLDDNFDAICDALANKGKVLKELVTLFEKEGDSLDTIIQIMTNSRGENAALHSLSEKLEMSQVTAHYLLNMPLEKLSSLNTKKLKKMLDDYKANIGKLVI